MGRMNFRNESEVMNAMAKFLSKHQIPFNIEEKSQITNYIYDFYLPEGMKNPKQKLGERYVELGIKGPTAIEVKGRLLFDTVQRYVSLFSEKLATNTEINSFLLVYVDGKLPSYAISIISRLRRNGFFVLSLSEFLGLEIDDVSNAKEFDAVSNDKDIDAEVYDWLKDRDKTLEIAKASLQDKDFSFFFGAGVSMSANLPSWWKLLEGLVDKSKQNVLDKTDIDKLQQVCYDSSIVLGRFIRMMMETKSDGDEYYNAIHGALYGGNASCSSPLITEICNLIFAKRQFAKGIITYNFDDVMERALNKVGINNYPVFGMNHPQQALPIYHVHGFIPYDNSQIIKSVPILSEEEYHRVYANSYNWSNVEQIHALSRTTCIFVGLSMTDPNLRRLLDISIRDSENEARHFVFLPHIEDFKNVKDVDRKNNEAMRIQKEIFLELGLRVIWYTDYTELPTLIGMLK